MTLPAQVAIKQVRTLLAESLRFPEQGQSAQGQSVPKARLKSVVDGKQVNIPVPLVWKLYKGGRRRIGHPPAGIGGLSVKVEDFGKSGSS